MNRLTMSATAPDPGYLDIALTGLQVHSRYYCDLDSEADGVSCATLHSRMTPCAHNHALAQLPFGLLIGIAL